jgi:cell division protein FtsN
MSQDFSKKRPSTTKPKPRKKPAVAAPKPAARRHNVRTTSPKQRAPFWAWILVGLCLIGFTLFLLQLSDSQSTNNAQPVSQVAAPGVKKTVDKSAKESQVHFDFYEILKGNEVEVEDRVIESTPVASNIIYWLQVASFRSADDADQQRAKLLLLNLDASIEKTQNAKNEEWHRVMVGPFTSRSKLAKARSLLASNEINSILIKRKATP